LDNHLHRLQHKSGSLEDLSRPLEKYENGKFLIVKNESKPNPIQNIRVSYHSNVYKYYEEFDSKIMFKVKPDIQINS
jgi:hypothetical protein